MFDFPNSTEIKSFQDKAKAKIVGSFHLDENSTSQAMLIKGLSVEEFNVAYPKEQYEYLPYVKIAEAKDNLKKGEDFNEQDFDLEVSKMTPVVVQQDQIKKLIYVREKKFNDLEKAGEGSRGGQVTGHSASGKPIYSGSHVNVYAPKSKGGEYTVEHKGTGKKWTSNHEGAGSIPEEHQGTEAEKESISAMSKHHAANS